MAVLMIWARANILGRSWTSRTRPGTGSEARARPVLFFLTHKKGGLFYFRGGVGYPPATQEKARLFVYLEGVRSQIGICGLGRASQPVPGLVPLKYFPPLEAATAADLA